MELSKADWASHLEEWRESGETATRYCEERGLKLGCLRYWSGRIPRKRALEASVASVEGSGVRSSVRFASVRVTKSEPLSGPTSSGFSGLRVRVGSAEVEVSLGFDEETLSRVLRVLGPKEAGQ